MKSIVIILISIFSIQALAVTSERQELSNYLRELNKIDRIFLAAENNYVKGSPTKFKYKVFKKDLGKLKQEIQAYLDIPNRSPRILHPVNKVDLNK